VFTRLPGQAGVGRQRAHRGAADGRDVYYSLDLERLKHLYLATGESLVRLGLLKGGAMAARG
jgi:hypothetical protein